MPVDVVECLARYPVARITQWGEDLRVGLQFGSARLTPGQASPL